MAKDLASLDILDFTIMFRDEECTRVIMNKRTKKVKVEFFTDINIKRRFNKKNPTCKDVMYFLESRCFPRTRMNAVELLENIGLSTYSPLGIIEVTHGVLWDDYTWIRFAGETLTFNDVKVRD